MLLLRPVRAASYDDADDHDDSGDDDGDDDADDDDYDVFHVAPQALKGNMIL